MVACEGNMYFDCRWCFYDGKPSPPLDDAYVYRKKYYPSYSQNTEKLHPVFKIKKSSSMEEFRKQYHKLAKECHPDKPNGSHEAFLKLSEAWEELNDPINQF